jgi:hypothetical protein
MGKLTGQTIADSYDQLLIVDHADGISSSLQAVESADTGGSASALQISTVAAAIDNPTTSSATQGGKLTLISDDGAALGDTHRLGVIEFSAAEDSSSTITIGARIEAIADAAWSASENGADMVFYTTDGNATEGEVMRLTAEGSVESGKDADKTSYFGRAAIGYDGTASDAAVLAHLDNMTQYNYALKQTSAGATIVNVKSGQNLYLAENGTAKVTLTGGNLGVNSTINDFTPTLSVEGAQPGLVLNDSATAGFLVAYADGDDSVMLYDHDGGLFIRHATSVGGGSAATVLELDGDASGDVTVSKGNLVIGTNGKGIDFSANTGDGAGMSSELLDDYEEGTWQPAFSTGAGTITAHASASLGSYTKIGNICHVQAHIQVSSISTSPYPSGAARITGLPFTIDNNTGGEDSSVATGTVWVHGMSGALNVLQIAGQAHTSQVIVSEMDGENNSDDASSHLGDTNLQLRIAMIIKCA